MSYKALRVQKIHRCNLCSNYTTRNRMEFLDHMGKCRTTIDEVVLDKPQDSLPARETADVSDCGPNIAVSSEDWDIDSSLSSLFSDDSRDNYVPSGFSDDSSSDSSSKSNLPVRGNKKPPSLVNNHIPTLLLKQRPVKKLSPKDSASTKGGKIPTWRKTTNVPLDLEKNEAGYGETEPRPKPVTKKRTWNKKYSCLFCKKLIAKLPRHLVTKHSTEDLVRKLLNHPKGSVERNKVFDEIRNRGNFTHNIKILTSDDSKESIITKKKLPKESNGLDPKNYLPCAKCLGFFSKKYLYRHNKICGEKETSRPRRFCQTQSALLLPSSAAVDDKFSHDVLRNMNNDEIFHVIRNDRMLLKYGSKLYKKLGHEKHLLSHVSQKVREMARFLKSAREVDSNIETLEQLLDPTRYQTCLLAVKHLAGFDSEKNQFKIPSLAKKTGAAIRKCAEILKGSHILTNNSEGINRTTNFISYFDINWTEDVSTHALRTEEERQWNKPKIRPLAEDLKTLNLFLRENISKLKTQLIENPSGEIYSRLAKFTLAHLVIFNRKRVGETQRLYIETLKKATSEPMDEDVKSSLSKLEIKLAESLTRVETRGKRGRRIPVLLTSEMKNSMDLLVNFRYIADISEDNPYVFASHGTSSSCLRGSDVLRELSAMANLKRPDLIRSSNLRKHIGTIAQVLNLQNHELDMLANFMGHDITVHRNFYRLPENTLELAKVSKVLIAMERGTISKYRGKSLDEIEIDVDEENLDSENDSQDVEDQSTISEPTHFTCLNLRSLSKNNTDKIALEMPIDKSKLKRKLGNATNLKTQKKEASPIKKTRKTSVKVPWTIEEKNTVLQYFENEINLRIVPKKDKCEKCILENPETLKNRTWKHVKFCVYNTMNSM